jgi:hypothetical protein
MGMRLLARRNGLAANECNSILFAEDSSHVAMTVNYPLN